MIMWNTDSGLVEVRSLEPWLAARGWHCALAGSVMYRGHSDKDLDVLVYPHDTRKGQSVPELWEDMLRQFRPEESGHTGGSENEQDRDDKTVKWWKKAGRRIDFFFLK